MEGAKNGPDEDGESTSLTGLGCATEIMYMKLKTVLNGVKSRNAQLVSTVPDGNMRRRRILLIIVILLDAPLHYQDVLIDDSSDTTAEDRGQSQRKKTMKILS